MAKPKRSEQYKIRVYSTKAGTQYVHPSEILFSEKAREDMRSIRRIFNEGPQKEASEPPADGYPSSAN